MRHLVLVLFIWTAELLFWSFSAHAASPVSRGVAAVPEDPLFITNGPSVYRAAFKFTTNAVRNRLFGQTNWLASASNYPPEVIERLKKRAQSQPQFVTNVTVFTNRVFDHFAPGWLPHTLLTNLAARSNGKISLVWSRRSHPLLWPYSAPEVQWNRNSIVWGMKGMTAISPCWQQEGAPGQVPITLITRRHGYTRGHGMGPPGYRRSFSGKRVWFVTAEDKVVEAKVSSAFVRLQTGADYTILMFKDDVPEGIEPVRVSFEENTQAYYPWLEGAEPPVVRLEQGGHASIEVLPGFAVSARKGGDSGSPDFLPYFDELIFIGGRTTSAPSPRMQEDINELCRRAGVNPDRYRMQQVDLSKYPRYDMRLRGHN